MQKNVLRQLMVTWGDLINMADTDGDLVHRLRADDLTALGTLFERYRGQVYRTAFAITHDAAAADDILQDCLLKIYQNAQRIDTDLPLAPWLYRVTVNLSYTWTMRHSSRWTPIEAVVEHLISPMRHAPDHVAEHNEMQTLTRQAITELPFDQRVVIVLHYLNDLDVPEIAEILELPQGTVKSRLFYAREALRRKLGAFNAATDVAHGYT